VPVEIGNLLDIPATFVFDKLKFLLFILYFRSTWF
jgi:hypothetical protein